MAPEETRLRALGVIRDAIWNSKRDGNGLDGQHAEAVLAALERNGFHVIELVSSEEPLLRLEMVDPEHALDGHIPIPDLPVAPSNPRYGVPPDYVPPGTGSSPPGEG